MTKIKIKTSLNANEFAKDYEVNDLPSLTIPDQTMTIPEILERYARGLPIGGVNEGYYDEEDDLPDPRTLDLEERAQLVEQFERELSEVKNRKNELSTNVDNFVENSQSEETLNEES